MTTFKPMLAASEIPAPDAIQFPLLASFKLDGIRCPIIDGVAVSRKLLPLPNRFFQQWVSKHAEHLNGRDGEVVVGIPSGDHVIHRTTSGIMSRDGEPDFKFYVFDDFSVPTLTARERHQRLRAWYEELPGEVKSRVELLAQEIIYDIDGLKQKMDIAMDKGFEGLILKHPHRSYKFGRSTVPEGVLLKWKEFADAEAIVLEVIEGETNTNKLEQDALGHAKRSTSKAGKVKNGTCGGFRVYSEQFGEFYVAPGSMTAAQSKEIWATREQRVGQLITFKYQPYGVLKHPRFPGWKCFRDNVDLD